MKLTKTTTIGRAQKLALPQLVFEFVSRADVPPVARLHHHTVKEVLRLDRHAGGAEIHDANSIPFLVIWKREFRRHWPYWLAGMIHQRWPYLPMVDIAA